MPPTRNAEEPSEAKVVTELGKEFNVDEVYGAESSFIGSLKSVNDFNPVEVPSSIPLNFDMTMLEVCILSKIAPFASGSYICHCLFQDIQVSATLSSYKWWSACVFAILLDLIVEVDLSRILF